MGPTAGYVAFDLETTGLSPKADRPLEIAAVRYDGALRETDSMALLVDPQMPIPLAVQRLTGIRDSDARGAPSPEEGMAQLAEFCADSALITHGGVFDLAFCRAYVPQAFADRLVFDTLDLARVLLPTQPSHSLPLLSEALALRHERPHRAHSDASATGELFRRLAELGSGLPRDTLGAARRLAGQDAGPLREFFAAVVSGTGVDAPAATPGVIGMAALGAPTSRRAGAAAPGDEVASSPEPPPPSPSPSPSPSSPPSPPSPLDRAVADLLGPSGPLAASDAYEYRESQVQMAVAVAQALERRRRLLVEAGTGVGKSIAYAAPLALWASRTGKRAVIATNTITLQEQLMDRELPAVMRMLPAPVSAVMLKGRNNYVSLRRWERWLAQPVTGAHSADIDALRFKLKVLVWLTQTHTGDRSELHLTGAEQQYWARIASDTNDCLGRECTNWQTRRCHMVSARHTAAQAQLVVTNHAVLLADSERQGQVLAAYQALVVDEAHHLEASATQQLGTTVTQADLALVLERLPARGGGALAAVVAECRDAGHRLFGDAKGFLVERLGGEGNGTVSLTLETREDPRFAPLLRSARHAVSVLIRAAEAVDGAAGSAAAQLEIAAADAEEELPLASGALAAIAAAVDATLASPAPDRVTWLELRAEQAELHDAPTSVAETLREHVFDRCDTTVLTSATLAVGGSFDFVRTRVGAGEGADELLLPSPFDYLEQALCVLTSDVPPYDDADHDRAMADLVQDIARRLHGRTLVLFTGYGPLKRVHALIGSRLESGGVAVLGQGMDGTRRQILRSFLADPRAVLLGTSSFWEGVDVPGDALRCVVIDKLPFAVPTDPLVRARTEGLADPFGQYILPMAVLRLKQGFGRLIRSSRDRGAVVLCDPRLATREYGPRFLQALPPAAVVRERASAAAAMIEAFVERGVVPEGVGESMPWSSSDMEPA